MIAKYRAIRIKGSLGAPKLKRNSKIELFIPNDGNLFYEKDKVRSLREEGGDLILEDYHGKIGLPENMAFDFSSTYIDLIGVINSPANIFGTAGSVDLMVPKGSKLELCISTSGVLRVDSEALYGHGYNFYGEKFYDLMERYNVSNAKDKRVTKPIGYGDIENYFDICIVYGLININKTSGNVTVYHKRLQKRLQKSKPIDHNEEMKFLYPHTWTLRAQLESAIKEENFEQAAELRDKINSTDEPFKINS